MNGQNKKGGVGSSDNSMLLLDDNQNFSESENPLIGGRNLKKVGDSAVKKGNGTG